MNSITKWKTILEYIDNETGEILAEIDLNNYRIINQEKNYEITKTHGIRKIRYYCKRSEQLTLFGNNQD